ncbi:MAG: hypothetical protein NZ602_04195 [Thermoguttaceae bacterium]|nr:hypothetical protein [Thermoguttaceae bacterium]MDW8037428.1 hypothetical protein [Thermoguttaceae bacterium]
MAKVELKEPLHNFGFKPTWSFESRLVAPQISTGGFCRAAVHVRSSSLDYFLLPDLPTLHTLAPAETLVGAFAFRALVAADVIARLAPVENGIAP